MLCHRSRTANNILLQSSLPHASPINAENRVVMHANNRLLASEMHMKDCWPAKTVAICRDNQRTTCNTKPCTAVLINLKATQAMFWRHTSNLSQKGIAADCSFPVLPFLSFLGCILVSALKMVYCNPAAVTELSSNS